MAANRLEASRPAAETTHADSAKKGEETGAAPAKPAALAGFKAWLPLALNVMLMPALAYATTTLFLLPKLKSGGPPATVASEGGDKPEGKPEESQGGKDTAVGKGKFTAPLSGKVLVNVAGSGGTRYLLANLTLVSPKANLKDLVEKNDAELRDVAASVLASKTIADLEKPGARNIIRSELISVFNNVLGNGAVNEIYLTEFAIQ